ncbi:MAG: hypothetical protein ACRCVW_02910 [Brevinema sp.]
MLNKNVWLSGLVFSIIVVSVFSYIIFTQSGIIYNERSEFFDKQIKAQEKIIEKNVRYLVKGMEEMIQPQKIAEILSKKTVAEMDFPFLNEVDLSSIHLTDHIGNILFSSQLFYTGKSIYSNIISWNQTTEPFFFFSNTNTLVGIIRYLDPAFVENSNTGYIIAEFASDQVLPKDSLSKIHVRSIDQYPPILLFDETQNLPENMLSVIANNYQKAPQSINKHIASILYIPYFAPVIYYFGNQFYFPPFYGFVTVLFLMFALISLFMFLRTRNQEKQINLTDFVDNISDLSEHDSVSQLFSDIENGVIYDQKTASAMMNDATQFGVVHEIHPLEKESDADDLESFINTNNTKSQNADSIQNVPLTTDEFINFTPDDENFENMIADEDPSYTNDPNIISEDLLLNNKNNLEENLSSDFEEEVVEEEKVNVPILDIHSDEIDDFDDESMDNYNFDQEELHTLDSLEFDKDKNNLMEEHLSSDELINDNILENDHEDFLDEYFETDTINSVDETSSDFEMKTIENEENIASEITLPIENIDDFIVPLTEDETINDIVIGDEALGSEVTEYSSVPIIHDIPIVEEQEEDPQTISDIALDVDDELEEISANQFNQLLESFGSFENPVVQERIYKLIPLLNQYQITHSPVAELKDDKYTFNIDGQEVQLSKNSELFDKILSQHKVLSLSGNISEFDYLKEIFPQKFIENLGELFIEPILDQQGDVQGIVLLGRDKNEEPLSLDAKKSLFIKMNNI